MVLNIQSPASHNQMLGQRISHPASTKFHQDFEIPAAKRRKRVGSSESLSLLQKEEEEEEEEEEEGYGGSPAPISRLNEIKDSEAESEDEDEGGVPHSSQTELESALPPVKTDKEAIAEYEATRAAEAGLHFKDRPGQRKWVQGKSSIYVDAFFLALETVLDEESHLFDEAETAVFQQWKDLSYEGQYLYVEINQGPIHLMVLPCMRAERIQICAPFLAQDRCMASYQSIEVLWRHCRPQYCR